MDIRELQSASVITREMMEKLNEDMPIQENDEYAVIVSGLGSTPLMEQYIIYHEVKRYLGEQGAVVVRPYVGNYVTSLDMNGVAITLCRVDDELKEYLFMDAECPALTQ